MSVMIRDTIFIKLSAQHPVLLTTNCSYAQKQLLEFLMSCSLSTSGSCLLSNAIICTQSSWSREARSKGNGFRNQALGLIRGQASNHQL